MIKKIFVLFVLLLSLPIKASITQTAQSSMSEKKLSIDNFLGNYYDASNYLPKFSISKENKKIKIDIFNVPFHTKDKVIIPKTNIFLCDVDKTTNTKIYLDCEDIQTKKDKILEELFKYVYVIIDTTEKGRFNRQNYLYFTHYNLGKKDYEKYNCEEKENEKIYDMNCRTIHEEGYKREE